MDDFCKSGGIPGVGIHTHVAGIAIVDVIGTAAGALFIGKMLGYSSTGIVGVFVLLIIIGTLLHMKCQINTTLVNALGYSYPQGIGPVR